VSDLLLGGRAVDRALARAGDLVAMAESVAFVMADLGQINLPPSAPVDAAQLRGVASLYLASTLEAAGIIQAAEDLTRLARAGDLNRELGAAAALLDAFWDARADRPTSAERVAMFTRLFGTPPGPTDAEAGENGVFEELLLDLCDAIIAASDSQNSRTPSRVRPAALALAENLAGAASSMTLFLAREVLDTLGQSLAILNHPAVKTALMARTMWDAVAALDRRLKRPRRQTLVHLRRGKAGMTVIAWLAEVVPTLGEIARVEVSPDSPVIDAAVDWLDETLELMNAEPDPVPPKPRPADAPARDDWAQLGA
jgi:hypothetical protein